MGRYPHTVLSLMPESDKDSSWHRGRWNEWETLRKAIQSSLRPCSGKASFTATSSPKLNRHFREGVSREKCGFTCTTWIVLPYCNPIPLYENLGAVPRQTKAWMDSFSLTSEQMSYIRVS